MVRGPAHRHRRQCRGVRGPRRAAGTQQHAVLLLEQVAQDLLRQLREKVASTCIRPWLHCSARCPGAPRPPAPIIAGLVPSNVAPEEIFTDHPNRFRAMIVESANPAHSVADSAACAAAFRSLGADGGLRRRDDRDRPAGALRAAPAASQDEKVEATFFNFEFPHNGSHLRRPLLDPLLEPEIWARLVRALGVIDDAELRPLQEAAARDRAEYAEASPNTVSANPTMARAWFRMCFMKRWGRRCSTGWAAPWRYGGSSRKSR